MKKMLADYICHTLGFEPYFGAYNNVYLKLENDEHRNEYYSYIIVYVENMLCIHKYPDKYLNLVNGYFRLKDSLECPTIYLREDISKFVITNDGNGVTCWVMSADSHVKKAL